MSTKPSTQQGRRTPLSLSGAVTKNTTSKGGNNAANGGGNNTNGHTSSNTSKQDSKLQQQKNEIQIGNNPEPRKQQPAADKKQHQNDNKKPNEKNQNGLNNNKQQQSSESKQQQQNKDKQQQPQQQNGSDDNNKVNEKDKNEKSDKLDKQQDKSEKVDSKLKEDKKVEQDKNDNKKEEKKSKELKDTKADKKEGTNKSDSKTEHQQVANDDKKSKDDNQVAGQKTEEKTDNIEVIENPQLQQNNIPVTPKSSSKANKTCTPITKTPTKISERTPQKSTPSNTVKTTTVAKREVTSTIDNSDVEMEILAVESSPIKKSKPEEVANINIAPSATSTPGKVLLPKRNSGGPKSELQLAMQTGLSPERPRSFSQISGRKSIRPISEYTPSKLQNNLQFRESYRRINTELDITNTSMNVTVGSEVPNNFSFSFFGRGRKRDRTSPQNSQSAIGELQTDMEISPPKKARLDMHGFFSAVSSPLSLLRNRFAKASLKCSTPVKLQQKLSATEDDIEVQNVSGVSVHEEITKSDKEPTEANTTVNDDNDVTSGEEVKEKSASIQDDSDDKEFKDVSFKSETTCGFEQSDIKITETLLQTAVGDPMSKKRCIVM